MASLLNGQAVTLDSLTKLLVDPSATVGSDGPPYHLICVECIEEVVDILLSSLEKNPVAVEDLKGVDSFTLTVPQYEAKEFEAMVSI